MNIRVSGIDLSARQSVIRQYAAAHDSFSTLAQEATGDPARAVEAAAMNTYAGWCLRAYLAESSTDKHPSPRPTLAKCNACPADHCDRCTWCRSVS